MSAHHAPRAPGPRYEVRIEYPKGLGPASYLQHKNRSSWSKRRAQQHAKDIREGRTGIRDFIRVTIEEV